MTLGALLVVGALGSASSAWGLRRGGAAARAGAMGGVLALVLVAMLAAASPTPGSVAPDGTGAVPGTLWNGALVPSGYLRLVIVLWAASSVVLAAIVWLLRGTGGLLALLPATLAALVGAAVSLSASTPVLGLVAAGATGLASVPVVLASPRAAAGGIAAREVRIAVATALVVVAVASVAPVVARLVLANPDGVNSSSSSGEAAAIAFGLLAMALAVAARAGAIPWHVRVSALTDVAPTGSQPLVIAWLPLPLAAVAVGVASGVLAPLAPPVGSAQALIVAATLLATLAAALVAYLQDDLRHAIGYLTIADVALVVLALAALDPVVWGPARAWLLTVAVTKTALGAWSTVVEDRFQTRSIPELRGWLRPSPVLGIALVLIVVATYGLPGWAVASARLDLTGRAAGGPWSAVLLLASLLTLPAYLRWLWLGVGTRTSHVERVGPELGGVGRLPARRVSLVPPGRGRRSDLPVEQERTEGPPADPAATPTATGDVRPGTGVGPRGRTTTRRAASAVSSPKVPVASAQLELPAPGPDPVPESGGADPYAPRHLARITARTDPTTRAAGAVRRHRTGVLSGAVLALALLASLVAFGALDVAGAAGEPGPTVAGVDAVGN